MNASDETLTPETSVDFKMFSVYQGLACAFGCCHQNRDGIILEYEIRGLFGLIRSKIRRESFAYSQLQSLKLETTAGYARIIVIFKTLEAAARLPGRSGRKIRLELERIDTSKGRELCSIVELRSSERALQESFSKPDSDSAIAPQNPPSSPA